MEEHCQRDSGEGAVDGYNRCGMKHSTNIHAQQENHCPMVCAVCWPLAVSP